MQVWNRLFGRGKMTKDERKWTFGIMLAFGVTGLIASFVLAVEEFHLIKNPDAILSCSFNIVLNCAAVMKTWQASVFGFPNMYIGLMSYPVVIAVALAGLSGVKFPRWYLVFANTCYLLGALFAYWLFFNSVYVIQVLCPWCLVITFSTTILLSCMVHYNLRENTLGFSKKFNDSIQRFMDKGYDKLTTAIWIALLIALVIMKFGDALLA